MEKKASASSSLLEPTQKPKPVNDPIEEEVRDSWIYKRFPKGEEGSPITLGDQLAVIISNINQLYGGYDSYDGAPIANAKVEHPDAIFLDLYDMFLESGSVFKLLFGPKSFMVVSDPPVAKYLLRQSYKKYDKGLLAEILEPIMGKGLIPADPVTWKARRRAIVPGLSVSWLNYTTVTTFGDCVGRLCDSLGKAADKGATVGMEEKFNSVSLDVIGRSVFNFDFASVVRESPVIKAVYRLLKEAEHRSFVPIPYWNLPNASKWIPRLAAFERDLKVVQDVLDKLIDETKHKTREEANALDATAFSEKSFDECEDASLLRFLVELRGEDTSNAQLRDDLTTLLIAGHETTAAVLTWTVFELSKAENKETLRKLRAEVDAVMGDERPDWQTINRMPFLRLCLSESLRLYPQPPFLIRRALRPDTLPEGNVGFRARLMRGQDVFLALYNLHRDPNLWKDPHSFKPERFLESTKNENLPNWNGYQPPAEKFYYSGEGRAGPLYPNENHADFAFLPFGGGTRKCVGDQFAFLFASVALATLVRNFDFELQGSPRNVGMKTGATIHTKNGLKMRVWRRKKPSRQASSKIFFDHPFNSDPLIHGMDVGEEARASSGGVMEPLSLMNVNGVPLADFGSALEGKVEGEGGCPFHLAAVPSLVVPASASDSGSGSATGCPFHQTGEAAAAGARGEAERGVPVSKLDEVIAAVASSSEKPSSTPPPVELEIRSATGSWGRLEESAAALEGFGAGEKELTTQDLEARELEEAEDPDPLGLLEEDDWEIVAAGWGEEVRNVYEEELRVGLAMIEEIL
uniref:Cytochrome P450 n=1 Tax=Chromera velia CCMP2878 TaxID=1169474 RepID=A0A0G4FU94_9ALVE|eukprot:Cvel_3759.t1-p1 / transcript=Cvel_3759.t1 / gene=Cvel_3759 / organism=Chromera_velia_CCMP2878 / gene_product=Cytochrome P450 97B3, chloroplastic, putative / transcript_product=Cytochrome P450 97B3, chloroplastic, putative / location=Cvel_scaffold157:61941-75872(+) / protein_length=803 / sequence_SO=supercontig / SO=protein_coding / is_pseudo=false